MPQYFLDYTTYFLIEHSVKVKSSFNNHIRYVISIIENKEIPTILHHTFLLIFKYSQQKNAQMYSGPLENKVK